MITLTDKTNGAIFRSFNPQSFSSVSIITADGAEALEIRDTTGGVWVYEKARLYRSEVLELFKKMQMCVIRSVPDADNQVPGTPTLYKQVVVWTNVPAANFYASLGTEVLPVAAEASL